jgi:hypothetical protein
LACQTDVQAFGDGAKRHARTAIPVANADANLADFTLVQFDLNALSSMRFMVVAAQRSTPFNDSRTTMKAFCTSSTSQLV